jgi:hypothetical protein
MTPRQTIAMVVCWIGGAALAAGVIAVPVGVILHSSVRAMASAGGSGLPASYVNVFAPAELEPSSRSVTGSRAEGQVAGLSALFPALPAPRMLRA